MKINKTQIILIAIIFVVFQCVFWMIPFKKNNPTVILGFIFLSVSLIGQVPIFMFAFRKGQPLKSKLYHFPVFKVGIVYALASVVLNTTFIVVGAIGGKHVPWQLPTILNIALLALALAGILITSTYANIIEGIEEKTAEKTKEVKMLRIDTASLVAKAKKPEIKKELEKFAELVKYSDPVSHEQIASLEDEIVNKTVELRQMLDADDPSVLDRINELKALMEERNTKCKFYKD